MAVTEAPAPSEMFQLGLSAPHLHGFVNEMKFSCEVCRAMGNVTLNLSLLLLYFVWPPKAKTAKEDY